MSNDKSEDNKDKKAKKVDVKDLDAKKDPKGGPIYMRPGTLNTAVDAFNVDISSATGGAGAG
jgi:hypothetical protein